MSMYVSVYVKDLHADATRLYNPTLSGSSGLALSFPAVGYMTPPTFHAMGLLLSSKVKLETRTDNTTSV